jgi:hypothetical protein
MFLTGASARTLRLVLASVVTAGLFSGCRSAIEVNFVKVSPEVLDSLRAGGETNVIVSLVPPAGYGEPGVDLDALKSEIARSQEEVLSALDPADYRNRIRFDAVPALAGTVLTQKGLVTLERHVNVTSVSLDLGGTGN